MLPHGGAERVEGGQRGVYGVEHALGGEEVLLGDANVVPVLVEAQADHCGKARGVAAADDERSAHHADNEGRNVVGADVDGRGGRLLRQRDSVVPSDVGDEQDEDEDPNEVRPHIEGFVVELEEAAGPGQR